MSKLTDKLGEKGVCNPYYFYGYEPYISLRVNRGSRDVLPSAWEVSKRGLKLSDAWYDYGSKCFSYGSREDKKAQLAEAQAWASEKFGIKEFARDPFGSYGDAEFIKRRIKEILSTENEQTN